MSQTTARMPRGIPYIIGNEFAERFSFYGMKGILTIFMTKYLVDSSGELATMSGQDASFWYHMFVFATYFTPLIGAIIADVFLGKYKTIITLSIVYCLGHLALALDETRFGLTIGLTLIAIGSGGIKPCVSAHVGDQFRPEQSSLLDKIFDWFYMSINIGSALAYLLIPFILAKYQSPAFAFGLPGLLMFIATIIFWMGRNEFISVKPTPPKQYLATLKTPEVKKAIFSLIPVYLLVSIFFSLFDQTGSTWVLQADMMDRNVSFLGFNFQLLPSQIQTLNPLMIILFIPICTYIIYPFLNRFFILNGLRKIAIGMLLAGASFYICAKVQNGIINGANPNIMNQFFAYLLLTIGEVMVSITALSLAYTQAPNRLKSFIMSFYLLSISLGNLITAIVNWVMPKPKVEEGVDATEVLFGISPYYFLFFTALTFVTAIILWVYSFYYKEVRYIQTADMIE